MFLYKLFQLLYNRADSSSLIGTESARQSDSARLPTWGIRSVSKWLSFVILIDHSSYNVEDCLICSAFSWHASEVYGNKNKLYEGIPTRV